MAALGILCSVSKRATAMSPRRINSTECDGDGCCQVGLPERPRRNTEQLQPPPTHYGAGAAAYLPLDFHSVSNRVSCFFVTLREAIHRPVFPSRFRSSSGRFWFLVGSKPRTIRKRHDAKAWSTFELACTHAVTAAAAVTVSKRGRRCTRALQQKRSDHVPASQVVQADVVHQIFSPKVVQADLGATNVK
jgi:hypothetical protein